MKREKLTRILYAEDEEDIRAIVRIALEDIGGLTVKYCNTGLDVLHEITEFQPDLVLLDVMMPKMDGPATLRELQKLPHFTPIPVVFMTAKVQPKEIQEYKATGVADVVLKPFDPMTLADHLNKVWESFHK